MPGPAPRSREDALEHILDAKVYDCNENNMDTACWIWRPGQWNSGNGYGKIKFQGVAMMVHRFVWECLRGPIPEDQVLDHKCRRRACCNPDHLELVTPKVNTYRGLAVLFEKTREEPQEA